MYHGINTAIIQVYKVYYVIVYQIILVPSDTVYYGSITERHSYNRKEKLVLNIHVDIIVP